MDTQSPEPGAHCQALLPKLTTVTVLTINSSCFFLCIFQVGTNFATDRDFAALDFLDHDLLGDQRPTRPFEETVDYGLEKLVL